jgi:hypothetical protein
VVGIGKPNRGVEGISRVIVNDNEVSDIYMFVSISPSGLRDCSIAGRAELLNLLCSQLRGFHAYTVAHQF